MNAQKESTSELCCGHSRRVREIYLLICICIERETVGRGGYSIQGAHLLNPDWLNFPVSMRPGF